MAQIKSNIGNCKKERYSIMRNIFIVNATQVVTSESHPEGLYGTVSGFPKTFDSNGADESTALNNAKSAYFAQLSANYGNTNPNRVMTTVTLEMANGRMVMYESIGSFPTEPEPEEEPEQ